MSDALPEISINNKCNYIAAFLTMACPYTCSYCINEHESSRKHFKIMPAENWIASLNRLVNLERLDGVVPVTLQGGEPSVHPGFYDIINGVSDRIRLDILTNLCFDVQEMISRVDPSRLIRKAPYASIRVSYHPDQIEFSELLDKTLIMQEAGFSIGLFGVMHPSQEETIMSAKEKALSVGVDFRTKEFLGFHDGQLYGKYKYPEACSMEIAKKVNCKTTEILIGPNGNVYRCHHDLYEGCTPTGNITDKGFTINDEYIECNYFGHCNPCDIKVKTNRLQQFGHTSVDIQFIDEHAGTGTSRFSKV